MSLNAAIEFSLPTLRAEAEAMMVDTCLITREAVEGDPEYVDASTIDPDTGQYPEQGRVTVYEGKCRLQVKSLIAGSSESDAGDRAYVVQDAELQLPVDDSIDVRVGHVAEVVSASHDAALVGRQLTVRALHQKTHATSRRLRMQEATG